MTMAEKAKPITKGNVTTVTAKERIQDGEMKAALSGKPIQAQLLYIQQALAAPRDLENQEKGFQYRTIEGVIAAVKPLLNDCGCTLTFSEDIRPAGDEAYVVSTATLRNAKGEEISSVAFAREDRRLPGMCSAQITGACISYARKYAAGGLFAIDNTRLAEPIDIDSLYPSLIEEVKSGEDAGAPFSAPNPEIPVNATRLPVLHSGAPKAGWDEEVLRVQKWTGSREDYMADLRSRWIVEDEALVLLFRRRDAPFAGEE